MSFELPDLPYDLDALAPNISARTLEFHHGKHHAGYVKKLNKAVDGTPYADRSLEDIVVEASDQPALYNNAAQAWNHAFYWRSLSPNGGAASDALAAAIKRDFGSQDKLEEAFTAEAAGHFGSGWAWLVRRKDGTLAVTSTHDAGNPLGSDDVPLITCDVWEHAYYLDYQNARPDYLAKYWELVNWQFASENFADAGAAGDLAA